MVLQETIPLENGDAVAAADVVCDLSSVALVVHQEELKFPDVGNEELFETIGEKVTCLLVASITNLQLRVNK